jgi:hypothetical protein
VLDAEPYRTAAVRLRRGHLEERTSLQGLPLDSRLARMVDANLQPVVPPPGGLVLSRDLADKLRLAAGDVCSQAACENAVPSLPGVAPIKATRLPRSTRGTSSAGRESQSITFLATPGIPPLYSGVAITKPSAAAIWSLSACTLAGIPSFLSTSAL